MKLFILTLAVIYSVAFTDVAKAATQEECQLALDKFITPIVEARDEGIDPGPVIQVFINAGLDPNYAIGTVQYIYVQLKDMTKEEVQADFMNNCVGEMM